MEFNIVEKLLGMTLLGSEWVLWLLIFLSILSVGIIIERGIFFSKIRLDFSHFTEKVSSKLANSDLEGVKEICSANPAIESQVMLKGLDYSSNGAEAMEQQMTGFVVGERQKLDSGLVVLGTLGNNAPFIGLFGTVIGIIKAFDDLASNPAGGPAVVMGGISEALVATAVGLLVAIPAVIAFNWYQRIVKLRIANANAVIKMLVAYVSAQSAK